VKDRTIDVNEAFMIEYAIERDRAIPVPRLLDQLGVPA